MKIDIERNKNRLEKIIMKKVRSETMPRWSSLWGRKCWISPCYAGVASGDGKQVVCIQPLSHRPNYYIVRVDSADVIDSEYDFENIFCHIEDNYGNADSDESLEFPALSVQLGFSYESVKIF